MPDAGHPDVGATAQPPGTSAKPMRRDAQRNQELVLEAARGVISEFGTDASMELIASRAGVGVGTVYRRFPNKEALVDELVRTILNDLISTARAALARADGTGLEVVLRAIARSLARHHGYAAKLVSPVKADCALILNELMAELLAQAKAFGQIGAEVTIGDVRATMWALRGVIETTVGVAPDAWERYLDLHLAGLRADRIQTSHPSLDQAQLSQISGSAQPSPSHRHD